MWCVYILQSEANGRYYIGMTSDIAERIASHNRGANRWTRGKGPWKLVYREAVEDKASAWKRERQIKSYKGGEAFKRLLESEH